MFRRWIIISSIAGALAGTAALAQGFRGKAALRGGFARQLRQGAAGRAFAGRGLERLQQRLNLTDPQMNGIRALRENQRTEMESLRQEVQQKRKALRELVQEANPNPADVGNATLALKESRERMRGINQRFISGVKGLLTPDPLQKLPKRLQ